MHVVRFCLVKDDINRPRTRLVSLVRFVRFAEGFVRVVSPDLGINKLKLRAGQKRLKNFCNSILLFFIVFLQACGEKQPPAALAFYHWKAKMDIGQSEMDYMDSLALKKLYVRFFDVHWDAKKALAYPLAPIQWKGFDFGHRMEIIPVIYITNVTIKNTEYEKGLDSLAQNIAVKLDTMLSNLDTVRFLVRELQIDCDWSEETEVKYFRFLEQLRKHLSDIRTLSATIRLHQVKYFTSTGVPPVDKGVLMFYNMGEIANAKEENSILNLETAKKYLRNFDIYPLPLDIALPLFTWGVQFREGRIIQLINDVSLSELEKNTNFTKIAEDKYKALKSDYLQGNYIYKNDEIRVESVSIPELEKAIKMLRKALGNHKHFDIIFYHLDGYIVDRFKASDLLKLAE